MVVATLSGDQPHRPHTFFSLNEHLTPPEASQHWLSRLIWTSSLRHTDTAVTTIQAVPVRTLGAEEEPPELQRIPTRSVPFSEDYGPPMDSYDSFNALPTLMYIQNDRLMHRRSISTHSAPAAFRPSLSPIESETGDLDYSLSALPDIVDTVSSKPIWNRGSRYSTGATSLGAYPLRLRLRRNTSSSSLAYDDKFNQGVSSAPNGVHLAVRDSVDFHGNGWNLHTLYTISVEIEDGGFLSVYGLDISSFDISKRYSEIRTLYFSLKRRFSKSITNWPRLPPKIPFGRFNLSVIASRMKAFGDLFEFVGTHQELLCSDEFVSFIQPPMKVTSTFVVDNATVPLRRSSTSAAQGGKLTYERERS